MTPSDSIEGKDDSLPASVSCSSSLDSMLNISGVERASSTPDPLANDTRHNHTIGTAASRGDGGPEMEPATRPQNQSVISPAAAAVAASSPPQLSLSSMVLPNNHLGVPMLPSGAPLTMPGTAGSNSIPEFLYQLTKMLTDNNRHIIEWTNGKHTNERNSA